METAMEMVTRVTSKTRSVKVNKHQSKRLGQLYEEIGRQLSSRRIHPSVNMEPLLKVMEAGEVLISEYAGPDWFQSVLINAENREAFEALHDDLHFWFKTICSTELSSFRFDLTTDAAADVEALLKTLKNIQKTGEQNQSCLNVAISKVNRAYLTGSKYEKVDVIFETFGPPSSRLEDQAAAVIAGPQPWKSAEGMPTMRIAVPYSAPGIIIPPELAIPMSEIVVKEEALIGQGSTANVKKADWLGLPCAVKIFTNDNETLARKEVELHQNLRSVYVVKLYGLAVEGNRCMALMELMDFNLHELILQKRRTSRSSISTLAFNDQSPFRIQDAVGLMLQISKGMMYLHHVHNILHGDLKTDNVLGQYIGKNNYRLKISDFGISEQLSSEKPTVSGKRGSSFFRAPEVLQGTVAYSLEADVYSFAMVSYEVLTGRRHFEGQMPNSRLNQEIINGRRPPLPWNLHRSLRNLVQRCWHENQHLRPPFSEICDELKRIETDLVSRKRRTSDSFWGVLVSVVMGFIAFLCWCRFNSRIQSVF